MLTDKCEHVNYYTCVLIMSKQLRTDSKKSEQFFSFGVRPA